MTEILSEEARDLAGQMLAILQEQLEVQRSFLVLARKKEKALVEGDLDEMEGVVRAERFLLWQSGRCEDERLAVQGKLAVSLGRSPEEVTLGFLVETLSPSLADDFRRLEGELRDVWRELEAVNESNRELLKRALTFVYFSLDLLTQGAGQGATYFPAGDVVARARRARALVDRWA